MILITVLPTGTVRPQLSEPSIIQTVRLTVLLEYFDSRLRVQCMYY